MKCFPLEQCSIQLKEETLHKFNINEFELPSANRFTC